MNPNKFSFIQRLINKVTPASTQTYTRPQEATPQFQLPSVIRPTERNLFIEEAKKAGVTPEEFSTIAKREQGASTTPDQVATVGLADPNDRGVMQVNKLNEPLVRTKFKEEYGRDYNPNSAADSIIAARMVLQENRRIFEQMKANQTYTRPYSNTDLIDSYNTGVQGLIKAKQGDREKQERLLRYQNAGLDES